MKMINLSTDTYTPRIGKVIDFVIQRLRARDLEAVLINSEKYTCIKGKLLLNESLKLVIYSVMCLCEFDEYTTDHKINQIIKGMLLSREGLRISNENIKILKNNQSIFHHREPGVPNRRFFKIFCSTHTINTVPILNLLINF